MRHFFSCRLWLYFFSIGLLALPTAYGNEFQSESSFAFIPNLWDPHIRREKPDLKDIRVVRILTDNDYPPFTMQNIDGTPTGFSVELAREACYLLTLTCDIQIRPFEILLDDLNTHKGDVVIAALEAHADLRDRYAVTLPYFRNPGHFMVRKGGFPLNYPSSDDLKGTQIVVVGGSAHEAFIKTFFPKAISVPAQDFLAAAYALKNHQTSYVFADGVNIALWVNGKNSEDCCVLAGHPYLENRYFGEGFVFTMRENDDMLRRAFDYAFQQLYLSGKYTELYLRFFPVNPY